MVISNEMKAYLTGENCVNAYNAHRLFSAPFKEGASGEFTNLTLPEARELLKGMLFLNIITVTLTFQQVYEMMLDTEMYLHAQNRFQKLLNGSSPEDFQPSTRRLIPYLNDAHEIIEATTKDVADLDDIIMSSFDVKRMLSCVAYSVYVASRSLDEESVLDDMMESIIKEDMNALFAA